MIHLASNLAQHLYHRVILITALSVMLVMVVSLLLFITRRERSFLHFLGFNVVSEDRLFPEIGSICSLARFHLCEVVVRGLTAAIAASVAVIIATTSVILA